MSLRLRQLPRFPSKILSAEGIKVERPSGSTDVVIRLNFGDLVRVPSIDDPDKVFFIAWNSDLNSYSIMSFTDTFAAVIDTTGLMLQSVYDPQNKEADAFARANHTGTQAISTVNGLQDALDAKAAITSVDGKVVYAAKGGNYTAVAGDNNAVHRFTAAATVSLTAAATLGANWHYTVTADGAPVTIDPSGSETINGLLTIAVPDGASVTIICDGSNFFTTAKPAIWEPVGLGLFTLVGASSLILTDLGKYQYLRISGRLSQNTAGILVAQFSTDNGGTFDSAANYFSQSIAVAATTVLGGTLTATGIVLTSNSPVTINTDYPFEAELFDFNKPVTVSGFSKASPIVSGARNLISNSVFHLGTTARNALRILNASGGTLSGKILIEGMRG